MPFGIGAYSDAPPVSGNVPPITICDLLMPGSAYGAAAPSVRANAPGRLTASANANAAGTNSSLFNVSS